MVILDIKCQRDEFIWKRIKWNVVNPVSEKPKFGRGTFRDEMKFRKDRKVDKCLPPIYRDRTWLIRYYFLFI